MQTHKYSVLQHFPALQWKHFGNVFYKEKVPSSSAPLSQVSRASSAGPFPLLPLLSMERAGHRRIPSACSSLPVPQKLHVPVTTLWLVLTLSQPNEEPKLTAWVSRFKKQAWSMPVLTSSCSSSQMLRIPPYRILISQDQRLMLRIIFSSTPPVSSYPVNVITSVLPAPIPPQWHL